MKYRASLLLLLLAALVSSASTAENTPQACDVGPLSNTYGNTPWLVYSCNNDAAEGNARVVLVSAPGNPAMPFVFFFYIKNGVYRLYGEGQGSKEASGAALAELQKLTQQGIENLIAQTKKVQAEKQVGPSGKQSPQHGAPGDAPKAARP
ncbi:hypothetical protein [Thiobacillus denitrificans]|uniref:hypothetical protein n=1 Tax=Thiobacillus denitrificans TaxID=36861 RepID=UPI0012F74BB6|nr:hypothetical protein [Thiobacillus denitrificans]